jgi:hypothetical protein
MYMKALLCIVGSGSVVLAVLVLLYGQQETDAEALAQLSAAEFEASRTLAGLILLIQGVFTLTAAFVLAAAAAKIASHRVRLIAAIVVTALVGIISIASSGATFLLTRNDVMNHAQDISGTGGTVVTVVVCAFVAWAALSATLAPDIDTNARA